MATVRVAIFGATLRETDALPAGDSTLSCVCEIVDKPDSRISTPVVSGSWNPKWNFVAEVIRFSAKDSLRFAVMSSSRAAPDDVLGECVIEGAQLFESGGAHSEVRLSGEPPTGRLVIGLDVVSMPEGYEVGGTDFTVMTFNVEEYWHRFDASIGSISAAMRERRMGPAQIRDWFAQLRRWVFSKITLVRQVIETHRPDVLCLEEHSLGLDNNVLERAGVMQFVDAEQFFTHEHIMSALLPDGYDFFVQGTGEKLAKHSELANLVAWRTTRLRRVSAKAQAGKLITPPKKKTPNGKAFYTPRSVACVELQPVRGGTSFVVCATHLMGGRFEDRLWAIDSEAGVNERVNQVMAIQELVDSEVFTREAPCVFAGDFNVMKRGFLEGPFAKGCAQYVIGDSMLYSRERMEADYREHFVPHQTAVHRKLEELGYSVAYGRSDVSEDMRTSRGGCPDWIYTKGLVSMKDEKVIPCNLDKKEGASDHNAVIVTLTSRPIATAEAEGAKSSVPIAAEAPANLATSLLALDVAPETKDRVVACFRQWNWGSDGYIDAQKLRTVLVGLGIAEDDVPKLFAAADLNKDGQIDCDEFLCWVFGSAQCHGVLHDPSGSPSKRRRVRSHAASSYDTLCSGFHL